MLRRVYAIESLPKQAGGWWHVSRRKSANTKRICPDALHQKHEERIKYRKETKTNNRVYTFWYTFFLVEID